MRSFVELADFTPTPKSIRIAEAHKQAEEKARTEKIFVWSDPSHTGGGLLYGPKGIIGAVSLGGVEKNDREARNNEFHRLVRLANQSIKLEG